MGAARDLVFLSTRNDAVTLTTYAAAILGGHPVALIDGRTDARTWSDLVRAYQPAVIAGSTGLSAHLEPAAVAIESVEMLHGTELIHTGYPQLPELHPDLALLLSTSGTTGSRKFVRLSMRNVESNARAIAALLELTPDERPITTLPLHYTFGLSVVNSHWLAGAGVVVTDETLFRPSFWEAFREHQCTSLAGVPFTYQLLERIGFREMALPSLRSLQQAGGALDIGLAHTYADFMAARGGRFFVMYGQTEATARIAYVPPDRLVDKAGSAGIAIPGGRLSIEPNGDIGPTDSPLGEVVYEGPNVMHGYAADREDLRRGDELHGVLHTGDIGYLDGDAYLFLVGRSKRIAKVFGHRINLDEVEAMLAQHGTVGAVEGSDSVWAFCSFGSPEAVTAAGDVLARRLRLNRSAVIMRHVDMLPATSAGKLDYQRLRQWVQQAENGPTHGPPTRSAPPVPRGRHE